MSIEKYAEENHIKYDIEWKILKKKNFSRADPIEEQIIKILSIVFVNTVRYAIVRLGLWRQVLDYLNEGKISSYASEWKPSIVIIALMICDIENR